MADKNKPKAKRALAPIGDYEVGYCKPPKATQFQKNQPSANRKGRPPKAQQRTAQQAGWLNGFHEMTLEEGMRPVQVREGNKVVSIPAYQAVLRSMFMKAGSGNTAAQRTAVLAVGQAQQVLRAEKEEAFAVAMQYKLAQTDHARRCDAKGIDHGLEIHPDDIEFDLASGEVIINGPKTAEERELLKICRDVLAGMKAGLLEACAEQQKHPRRTSIAKRIELLAKAINDTNALLPQRYRCDVAALLREKGFI